MTVAYQRTAPEADTASACQLIEQLPACVNLSIYEGDDFYLDLAVTDQDAAPVDVTGAIISGQIRPSAESDIVSAEFTGTVDGTDPSLIHLHLPSASNVNMPSSAVWDCEIDLGGSITTLAAGTVTVKQEVTRPL